MTTPTAESTQPIAAKTPKPKKVVSAAAKAAHAAKFAMKPKHHDPTEVRPVRFRSLARKVGATIFTKKAAPRLNRKMKARIAHIVPLVHALMSRDPTVKNTIVIRHVATYLRLSGVEVY